MYIFDGDESDLGSWIKKELVFPGDVSEGKRGITAKRIQEWLCLHDNQVVVDSDFGKVTQDAVNAFQVSKGLAASGVVDHATHNALVEPMRLALAHKVTDSSSLAQATAAFAKTHLKQHPREVGGANRGPWVRMYMKGNEGTPWAWCAGFTTFCIKQAAQALATSAPIKGSFSCDSLAAQAKEAGIFVSENSVTPEKVTVGSMFLVRRTSTDWTHVGFVTDVQTNSFRTLEGNTNDDGDREGYEVCARRRGYTKKDFILI